MFTGIITGIGRICEVLPLGAGADFGHRLTLSCPAHYLDDVAIGDSIAINGACMTVAALEPAAQQFSVEVSAASRASSTGLDAIGRVNLEKALRASDRLGGHLLSGHVDGVAVVHRFEPQGESHWLQLQAPQSLAKYLAYKGSVGINGVSLTINEVQNLADVCQFSINLITHTLQHSTLADLQPASRVNLEVDMLARYVEHMLNHRQLPV